MSGIDDRYRKDWLERNSQYLQEVQVEASSWTTKSIQSNQSTVEFGVQAIKACYLLNAGGVGVLAAAGALLKLEAPTLVGAATPFFVGLLAGVVCNVFAYLAQGEYSLMCDEAHHSQRLEIQQRYFAETKTKDLEQLIEAHKAAFNDHADKAHALRIASIWSGLCSLAAFVYAGVHVIQLQAHNVSG
ncbi:hypothetical protein ACFPL7_22320 [Dongia soli]|uniref:SMODS and SLOG-associating 2TM effector domain-containing protein n=1 Tax=Dongia soli TaxID=600628 RepID=A0ABU5E7M0_9PROT|nr:hypothetical protein [Dongia soli]MDY0882327.1 hypothetical protein [Dongia soli]